MLISIPFVVMANRPFRAGVCSSACSRFDWLGGARLQSRYSASRTIEQVGKHRGQLCGPQSRGYGCADYSTLSEAGGRELLSSVNSLLNTGEPVITRMNNLEYLTLSAPLEAQNGRVELVVQRSLAEAMTDFRQMRLALLLIGGAALLGAIFVDGWQVVMLCVR